MRNKFNCMNFDTSAVDFINIDKAFFSCTAFSAEKGAMVPDLDLATTERSVLKRAGSIVLLCDSSKFGSVSSVTFASFSETEFLTDRIPAGYEECENVKMV